MLKAVVIFVVVCGVLSDSVPLKPPAAAEPSVKARPAAPAAPPATGKPVFAGSFVGPDGSVQHLKGNEAMQAFGNLFGLGRFF